MRINKLPVVSRFGPCDPAGVGGQRARGMGHDCGRPERAAGLAAAALLCIAFLAMPALADPQSELARARHDLAISEQVLARVTERAEAARSDPATGPEQRQRLDEYVARVRSLVASNREQVRILSMSVDAMPAGTAPATPRGETPPAATQAEEVSALETRLGGSLAEFDQLLLEEARRARAPGVSGGTGPAGRSGGGASGPSTSKGVGTRSKAPGTREPADTGTTTPRTAGDPGSPGRRIEGVDPETTGATASSPPGAGDGSGDDIVAREIRKMAESEPDPELRAKLWEEYLRYKQGT